MIRAGDTCAWALAAVAFAIPNSAAAQSQCPAVRSIVSGQFKQLEGVGITINAAGKTDLTKHGTSGIVRNASNCDLSLDDDGFDVTCNWRFAAGEDREAEKAFDRLRRDLDDCLPSLLEQQTPRTYTDAEVEKYRREYGDSYAHYLKNTLRLQEYELFIELASDDEIEVDLSMHRAKYTGLTTIDLNFYR